MHRSRILAFVLSLSYRSALGSLLGACSLGCSKGEAVPPAACLGGAGCTDSEIPSSGDAGGDMGQTESASDAAVERRDDFARDAGNDVSTVDASLDARVDVTSIDGATPDDGTGGALDAADDPGKSPTGDSGFFPSDGTTQTILSARGPDCLPCAERSGCLDPSLQGGTCEGTPGIAPDACSAVLGTASAPTEALVCIATLNAIFTSGCALTRQETPCYCGAADPGACLAGTAPPSGPVLPIYACDFTGPGVQITSDFTNQAFGAGQANALVQCLAILDCDCFP